MPKNKKKVRGTRKQESSMSSIVHRSLGGFRSANIPDMSALKFIYEDYRTITSSSGIGEYVYRLNSLFDPDFTGVGGQPPGFDQWKLLYGVYRVLACQVDIEVADENGFALCTMAPTVGSALFADPTAMGALRHSKSVLVTNFVPKKMSALFHIADIYGVNDESVLLDDLYGALVTANPSNSCYLHIAQRTTGVGDLCLWRVRLTFYARLEQPIATDDTLTRVRAAVGQSQRQLRLVSDSLPEQQTRDATTLGAVELRSSPTSAAQPTTNKCVGCCRKL
jgi:hypothetical protein